MKRAEFLRKLGLGAVAVAIAPKVIAKQQEKKVIPVVSPNSGKVYSVIQEEPYEEDDGDFVILHVNGKTFMRKKFKQFNTYPLK